MSGDDNKFVDSIDDLEQVELPSEPLVPEEEPEPETPPDSEPEETPEEESIHDFEVPTEDEPEEEESEEPESEPEAPREPESSQKTHAEDRTETVVIDGVEMPVKLSDLKARYQKEVSAEVKFRQAAQLKKYTDEQWESLAAVSETGAAGIPKPFETMLTAMAKKHYGGSMARAQEAFHQLLWQYAEGMKQFEENPGLREIQWQKYDLEAREKRLREDEKRAREVREDARINEAISVWRPYLNEALKQSGVHPQSAEAKRAGNFLIGKIVQNDKITQDTIHTAVAEATRELEQLAREKLGSLKAEDLLKANPKLAQDLLRHAAEQAKRNRPTVRGKAPSSKPTKPRRRATSPEYVDSIEELQKSK